MRELAGDFRRRLRNGGNWGEGAKRTVEHVCVYVFDVFIISGMGEGFMRRLSRIRGFRFMRHVCRGVYRPAKQHAHSVALICVLLKCY